MAAIAPKVGKTKAVPPCWCQHQPSSRQLVLLIPVPQPPAPPAKPPHGMPWGWVRTVPAALVDAAEVVLDWLWFSITSSSAAVAAVNPLLLQTQTGQSLLRADQLMAAIGENVISAAPAPRACGASPPELPAESVRRVAGEQAV